MKEYLNGHGEFAFDDNVPRPGPDIFIKRLKGQESLTCTILGAKVHGVWCHWNPKSDSSEPHYLSEDECPGCKARRPKRWKGYVHCFAHNMGQEIFLELTPHSAQSLQSQIGPVETMRANRLRIERGKGDNGKLSVTVLTAERNADALPREKSPQPSILKLWGFDVDESGHWRQPAPA